MKWWYIAIPLMALWLAGVIYRRVRGKGKLIAVDSVQCTGCRKCIKLCRHDVLALSADVKGAPVAVQHPDRCTACGDCLVACKAGAMRLESRK